MGFFGKPARDGGREAKGGKPFMGLFIILLSVALSAFSYHSYATASTRGRSAALTAAALAAGEERGVLRVEVCRQAGGIVTVRARSFDLSGRALAVQELAFPGTQAVAEFLTVPAGREGKGGRKLSLVFPRRISGGTGKDEASLSLFPARDANGFPAFLEGGSFDTGERKLLAAFMRDLGRADLDPAGPAARSIGARLTTVLIPAVSDEATYDIVFSPDGQALVRNAPSFGE